MSKLDELLEELQGEPLEESAQLGQLVRLYIPAQCHEIIQRLEGIKAKAETIGRMFGGRSVELDAVGAKRLAANNKKLATIFKALEKMDDGMQSVVFVAQQRSGFSLRRGR